MKVVLDTNVFISGVFFRGPPFQILRAWRDNKIQITISQEIFDEYHRVANELSREFPPIEIEQILELIKIHSKLVETHGISCKVCSDPDDDKFFDCAIAGKSKIIISGDKHLLKVSGYKGISVLKPRDFTDNYLKNG